MGLAPTHNQIKVEFKKSIIYNAHNYKLFVWFKINFKEGKKGGKKAQM